MKVLAKGLSAALSAASAANGAAAGSAANVAKLAGAAAAPIFSSPKRNLGHFDR